MFHFYLNVFVHSVTGDETNEVGKDDASRRGRKAPRSPKRGTSANKKDSKDEKPPSVIGEQRKTTDKTVGKPVVTREGFAPRGEPSRRGRGGGGSSRPRGGLGKSFYVFFFLYRYLVFYLCY
jgi:hypothetical protein